MRTAVVTGISVLAAISTACKREQPSKTADDKRATPALAPPTTKPDPPIDQPAQRPPCPHSSEQRAAVRLGSVSQTPIEVTGGIAWPEGRTLWLLPDNEDKPRTISKEELDKLAPKPTRYLKRRCGDGGCGEHGNNVDLVLIDGATEHIIAKGQSEIEAAKLVGDDAVWASFGPYGDSGGLYRAPAAGGQVTKLWDGAVTDMLVDGNDIYAAGTGGVAWVDAASGNTVVLDKTSKETKALAVSKDRIFWADEGTPYWDSKPSGRIVSAPRHGGPLVTHASEQPWPQAIAVDDGRIYWGSRDKGGVWSVHTSGGPVETLVPTDKSCGGVMWLHRTARGLVFVRGDELEFHLGGSGEIWFVPIDDAPKAKPHR